MIAQAEIRRMSLSEKLSLLEAVWAELSSEPDQVEVPQWHKDLLDERMQAAKEGKEEVLDCRRDPTWIRNRIRSRDT